MIYILSGLCILFDYIYIICKKNKKNIIGLIAKCLAALCFIVIGKMACIDDNNRFNRLILIGFILDGIGDLFLAIRNIGIKNIAFFIGGFSFLLGHIFFIIALININNSYKLISIILGIFVSLLISNLLKKICKINKKVMLFGYIYLAMIFSMVGLAVSTFISISSIKNLLFMIGAIFFVSSDCILIAYNFSKNRLSWMHPTYSLLYFMGQILIAISLNVV